MQNCKTSARTAAKTTFKCSLFFRPALLVAIPMLAAVSSCTMKAESDYNRRSWELKQKSEELKYLTELYSFRDDILFEQKIKTLDSLIKTVESFDVSKK